MHRATRWLAAEAGIRQFIDIGTGIPTEPNLHQIAQGVAPDARVVYADNDPVVLAHAQALLHSTRDGRTACVHGDVRKPESILDAAELRTTLDLSRPVALSLNALLHFVPDEYDAYGIVQRLVQALPSGSYLAISHCTGDFDAETWAGSRSRGSRWPMSPMSRCPCTRGWHASPDSGRASTARARAAPLDRWF